MGAFGHDLRAAFRIFAKNPGFAAVAIFTLAVGIGANTGIFSVANALLLRPLPYALPERLVLIGGELKDTKISEGTLSWPRFQQIEQSQRSFAGIAAVTDETFDLTGRGDPEQLSAARVSGNFFDVLGVHPAIGRSFRPDEDRAGGGNVVLISQSLWERRFASDPHVEGRQVTLDSKDFTIIGVVPRGFQFAVLGQNIDVWAPRVFELNVVTVAQVQAGVGFLNYVARLRDGVTIRQAQAEMDAIAAQYRRDSPKAPDANPRLVVRVANLQEQMVAGVRSALLILFGAVGLVLLISCANVSNLMLSRALGRQREMAVRTAIGATRVALVRQLLTESILLALTGGLLGATLGAWGTHALAAMAHGSVPLASDIRVDAAVLAFTVAVSTLAGVLFGMAPALQVSRPDLNSVLRSEGRGATSGRRRNLFRNLLVVSQVALSTILLVGAGLLLRNLIQLRQASPGFDPQNLLTMHIVLPPARYSTGPQMIAFYRDLVERVSTLPGVRQATISSAMPLSAVRFSPALPDDQPVVPLAERPLFNIQTLGPRYLEAMRRPLLSGREFNEHDEGTLHTIAVNQTLVRRFWPNENPVGKHILIGRATTPAEVVGVFADIHNSGIAADVRPEIFIPFAQLPWSSMNLLVRTAGDPNAYVSSVRRCLDSVDKDQPVTRIATMEEVLATGTSQPRFLTTLLGSLSAIALVLAIVGIYGVIAYSVSERTQEMGIRLALGAEPVDILRLVLRQGLALAVSGIALGIAASLMLSRLMVSLLYHVSATDPSTFAASAALFAAVAILASYIPARRATRVDPMTSLRWQ